MAHKNRDTLTIIIKIVATLATALLTVIGGAEALTLM